MVYCDYIMSYCEWPSCAVTRPIGTWPAPSCCPPHGQVVRLHIWSTEWYTMDLMHPVLQCCLVSLSRNLHFGAVSRRWCDVCPWSLSYITYSYTLHQYLASKGYYSSKVLEWDTGVSLQFLKSTCYLPRLQFFNTMPVYSEQSIN